MQDSRGVRYSVALEKRGGRPQNTTGNCLEHDTYRTPISETVLSKRTMPHLVITTVRSYLKIIRLAAAKVSYVDLQDQESVRRTEVFPLRSTFDGNILLKATRTPDGEHRSYRIDRIQCAKGTV